MNNDNNLIRKTFAGCLILERIGQGGMGVVYKAHHIKLNKVVCVKILAKELEADPRNIDFFLREAEISKQLDHPNTIHVYDYGKEKDNYYIVMSYVEGKSLDKIVSEKKFLDVKEASDIMLGVFEGLAHAHSKNIIHRDIKPSNIIVTKDGVPRIIDFGLARRVVEEKQLTITGEMIGTAYFMSPEQCRGIKVDHRTDLYSAGATYFYLLTGKYPFDGKTAIDVINKQVSEPLPNLYLLKPELPVWTVRMIEKLMKKNPDERYQSAVEVVNELKRYKEKNYENILDDAIELDLNDLKNKQEEVSKTIRIKINEKNILSNIEVKSKEKGSFDSNIEYFKEKQNESDKNLSLNTNEFSSPKNKKIQAEKLYLFSRIVYHFFLTFVGVFSLYFFSSFIKANSFGEFIKEIIFYPFSLIFILLSFALFYIIIKKFEIKSFILYISSILLVFFITFLNIQNKVRFSSFFDSVIYFLTNIKFNGLGYLILSLFSFFIFVKLNFLSKWKKNLSYFLFLISFYFFISFISSFFNFKFEDFFDKTYLTLGYILIIFLILSWLISLYINIGKSIILFLLYISFAWYFITNITMKEIHNEEIKKYNEEVKKYNEMIEKTKAIILLEKEKIKMQVSEKIYQNIDKYQGDINEIINKETQKELQKKIDENISKISLPDKNKIKQDVSKEYFDNLYKILNSEIEKKISLLFFSIWLFLNALFMIDNLFYEL
jgi:serine/threonine protein kinase